MVGHVSNAGIEEREVCLDDVTDHDLQLGLEWRTLYTFLKLSNHPRINLTGNHLQKKIEDSKLREVDTGTKQRDGLRF